MTPCKSNYITFTRGSPSITAANGETTIAEDILVDLPILNSTPTPFLLKDVWYIPDLDCNLLPAPQVLNQSIAAVFAQQGGGSIERPESCRIYRY